MASNELTAKLNRRKGLNNEEDEAEPAKAKAGDTSAVVMLGKRGTRRASTGIVDVVAYGSGGLEEMQGKLDDKEVVYAIVTVPFGEGSFRRDKSIMVHFNGESCGVVKRGRANAKLPRAESALRPYNASLQIGSVEQCTEEYFRAELASKFMDDSNITSAAGGSAFTIKDKVSFHNAAIEAAKKPENVRLTAAEMSHQPAADRCLAMVRDIKGPFNWVLLKPNPTKLTLHNAGGGSVEEMREKALAADEVLYGLVRMGFGTGRFRRNYWFFVHWIGPEVAVVKRGRHNAAVGAMQAICNPFACSVTANDIDDITLPDVIAKLKSSVVVEGAAKGERRKTHGENIQDAFSLEAFQQALREEQQENAEFFGVDPDAIDGAEDAEEVEEEEFDMAAILQKIKNEQDPLNWAIFNF
uniref:ADF-H domain-containing protein n=2 Tax=Octactis speculum TaxID=3111310 RepID=A0A7S2MK62_9STRA|mmetsp:Transcript_64044/g.87991  ORF Transcript_64044/g.87991 Transcript_64044/m.87991 type:complete len:412 (+) Transcript_64044:31-1266(+)